VKKAATEFYVKFLVALITSPRVGVRLRDVEAPISANRKRQIATQLAEAEFITPYYSTKGRRWVMDNKLLDLLAGPISVRPEILIGLTNYSELKFPERFTQIREAADKIRSAQARRHKKVDLDLERRTKKV
jgi:hypothetical protein